MVLEPPGPHASREALFGDRDRLGGFLGITEEPGAGRPRAMWVERGRWVNTGASILLAKVAAFRVRGKKSLAN